MIKGVPALPPTEFVPVDLGPRKVQKTQKNEAKKGEQKWRHGARKSGA